MSSDQREWAGPAGFTPDPRISEYPATFIRDWITLSPDVPDFAFRAYCVIRAHIWEKDERRQVTLTQEQMGAMLGKSTDRVRKIIKPLLSVGLLSVAGKKSWFEYNAKTGRREKRTMNVYAVTDFPGPGYEGPKSLSDFSRRFAQTDRPDETGGSSTDRSKTTGGSGAEEPAGHTDRSKTTGGPSSQVSDISAGQTDRSKTASTLVENDPPYKNSFKQEGEEGDARARASEPSPNEQPVWGVRGTRRPTGPTLAAADLIADLADLVLIEGEELSADDHQGLAGMVDAVRPVVEAKAGLSWPEYLEWLKTGWIRADGRRTFKDFTGTLRWRLKPEQVTGKAWPWACERRGAQEGSGPQGGRKAPSGPTRQLCGVHRLTLMDGRCLSCDQENAHQPPTTPDPENEFDPESDPDVPELSAEALEAMYGSLFPDPEEAARRKHEALEAYRRGTGAEKQ